MKRANYLGAPQVFRLNHACRLINDALGGTCYLVGSSLERRDYRDVDVRLMLSDEDFDRLFFGTPESQWNARWSFLCMTTSTWLREQTGLPVDFQIQRATEANAKHEGQRQPLGFFLDYPGDRPREPAINEKEPTP